MKRLKLLLLQLMVLVSSYTFAQPNVAFMKNLGGTKDDVCTDMVELSNGAILACGYTTSNDVMVTGNHGSNDAWIVKLSSTGTVVWKKIFGGTLDDRFYSVSINPANGNIFLTGYTSSNDGDVTGNHGSNDLWVVKLSSSGVFLQQKCFGGTLSDRGNSIDFENTATIMIAGYCASSNGDVTVNNGGRDFWILKIDQNLNLNWQKSYGGSFDDEAQEVSFKLTDSNEKIIVVAGWTSSNDGNVTGNHGSKDAWVIRVDDTGNLLWQKAIGGTSTDEAFGVVTSYNDIYLIGGTFSNDGDFTGNHGGRDGFISLIRIGNSTPTYSKLFGGTGNETLYDLEYAGYNANNGDNFIMSGSTTSNNGDVSGNHSTLSNDMWLLKTDTMGAIAWNKCIGGANNDDGYTCLYANNFGYFVGGRSSSIDGDITAPLGLSDFAIAKTTPDPPPVVIYASINFTGTVCPSLNIDVICNVNGTVTNGNIYRAYLSDSSGSFTTETLIGSLTSNLLATTIPCVIPKTAKGTNYKIRIKSSNTPYTAIATNTPFAVACKAPSNLVAVNVTATDAYLEWNDATLCTTQYQIYYRVFGTTVWGFANIPFSDVVLSGLSSSTKYQWKVRSKCASGPNVFSPFTTIKTFTTLTPRQSNDELIESENTEILNVSHNVFMINILNNSETVTIDIIDMNGRIAMQKTTNENSTVLDLNSLTNGMYIVRCYSNNYSFNGKILVN
ncbi:MAG: T9SS type A sorting domain-containing protein [Bacteroidetes bacterium]|nr:T9SS type A sorting domain-containing protein [Bacteroidota bacterium]